MEQNIDFLNLCAKRWFGIEYIFPYQRLVIYSILERVGFWWNANNSFSIRERIIILPTGSGKSLCFMLPGMLLKGITVIIFPLLSLLEDQRRRLEESGAVAAVVKGGMKKQDLERIIEGVNNGSVKFLLTIPEMINQKNFKSILEFADVEHIVIDEAHTVPDWGESFRPAYMQIASFIANYPNAVISAFTATASPMILNGMERLIFLKKKPIRIETLPDRPNIHYSVRKTNCIISSITLFAERLQSPMLVFCNSRKSTENYSKELSFRLPEREIFFYHAGLDKDEKSRIEEWFFYSENGILFSTCAYGMGVNKRNIRTVIHAGLPSSIEAYLQESGRAGRDQKLSRSILLTNINQENKRHQLFSDEKDRIRFEQLLDYSKNSKQCRREMLMNFMNAELNWCSGCDICGKQVVNENDLYRNILNTLKPLSRIASLSQMALFLKGRAYPSMIKSGLVSKTGFGSMSSWYLEDIIKILENLKEIGSIKKIILHKNIHKIIY